MQGFLFFCYLITNVSVLGFQCVYKLELCVHIKLCIGLCKQVFTWVNVKLAFHRLGNALQFDSLQAVSVDSSGQGAQRLPDEAGHLTHGEDLQKLAINCWKCPQEHRLDRMGQCSIIWRLNRTGTMNPLSDWNHFVER